MNPSDLFAFAAAFGAALLVGTFAEYAGHRLMHMGQVLRRRHARHHQQAWGQGWLREFRDYFLPTLAIIWVGFLHSPAAGFGFLVGDVLYAAVAAFAHQLQHEQPELMFWLRQPVHTVHHQHNEWHHNFGILVDIWDRALGTYKAHEPGPDDLPRRFAPLAMLNIHWVSQGPALTRRRGARSTGVRTQGDGS